VDLYEINEAFASQATFSVNKLGIDTDKVKKKEKRGVVLHG
jgi:acetyl-CoA acetyltransferase